MIVWATEATTRVRLCTVRKQEYISLHEIH